MVSRPSPGRAISEALCPDCAFPCGQAPGRRLRVPGATPPQPGGGLLERICPVEPLFIVPRRLAGGCAPRLPGGGVTEKRILDSRGHGKAHSGGTLSRKSALCLRVSPKGAFCMQAATHTAPFREVRRADCAFPCGQAPGRRLRVPGATPPQPGGGLLERICPVEPLFIVPRSLAGGCAPRLPSKRRNGKAHSGRLGSRKSALWGYPLTERRILRDMGAADCASP